MRNEKEIREARDKCRKNVEQDGDECVFDDDDSCCCPAECSTAQTLTWVLGERENLE